MFIPFKSQVYLPILERAFSRDDLHSAFRFYLDGSKRPVDLDAMHRNRLAQNDMMRQLCEGAGIPLHATAALERAVTAGDNVYFRVAAPERTGRGRARGCTVGVSSSSPDFLRRRFVRWTDRRALEGDSDTDSPLLVLNRPVRGAALAWVYSRHVTQEDPGVILSS